MKTTDCAMKTRKRFPAVDECPLTKKPTVINTKETCSKNQIVKCLFFILYVLRLRNEQLLISNITEQSTFFHIFYASFMIRCNLQVLHI